MASVVRDSAEPVALTQGPVVAAEDPDTEIVALAEATFSPTPDITADDPSDTLAVALGKMEVSNKKSIDNQELKLAEEKMQQLEQRCPTFLLIGQKFE
jgi:hypothetical protein